MANPFSKSPKLFSIVTPVYEDAWKTFPKFFQALDEQAYKHFEVIVVFDGKNPVGVKALKESTDKYPTLKVRSLTIEHGGAPKARNAGAEIAKGDYLSFLDPDVYLYSESLQIFASKFDEHPDKDVVWGLYDILQGEQKVTVGGSVPCDNGGTPDYYAFRSCNYCSGMFPLRKEAFVGWDETVKSLQDWDMWVRMLKKDDFKGEKFLYVPRSFAVTEPPGEGGISDDSSKHWLDRLTYVKMKNSIPYPDIVVSSLGAPFHGVHAAKKLGADFLPMPSFKPHNYRMIYLLGFYPASHESRMAHLNVFAGSGRDAKKVIHWIGTDVYQLDRTVSSFTLRELKKIWNDEGVIHLAEVESIQEELGRLGIMSMVVPIPPNELYTPLPLPEVFSVGIYENATQNMYHETLMEEVVRSMPDIQFYFFGDESKKGLKTENSEHLGWINLQEWMPKFSCNLRISVHDGLPLTPLQFMTAGRSVVTNTPLEGAVVVSVDRKEIVEAIRSATEPDIWKAKQSSDLWRAKLNFTTYKDALWKLL